MRAVFGVVSLLVVLALVGMLASRQLQATRSPLAALPGADAASVPAASNARDQARLVQQQVNAEVAKALEQGAAARRDETDK